MKRWMQILAALVLTVALSAPAWAAISAKSIAARFSCTAGEALAAGDVVAIKSADGKCWKGDNTGSTIRPAVGWVVQGYASGVSAQVVYNGLLTGFSALTKGAPVYLGTTGGNTQTAPAYPQVVGWAISATDVVADIQRPLDSSVASAALKTRSAIIQVPDPGGADADIAAGYVLWRPSVAVTITKVEHIPQADWVAAAAANDATVVVTNAAVGTVATLAVVTALAKGSVNDMGAITNAAVVANSSVTIAVTTNGTADAPASIIQIEYTTSN